MEYPGNAIKDRPATELNDLLRQGVVSVELFHFSRDRLFRSTSKVARSLGAACVDRNKGLLQDAQEQAREARELTHKISPKLPRIEQHRLELQSVFYDLISPNGELEKNRHLRHESSIHALRAALRHLNSPDDNPEAQEKGAWYGFLNELTILALINRLGHPWITAVPALVHHDKQHENSRDNYDILVAISGPDYGGLESSEPTGRFCKIQVKSSVTQQQYSDDIHVIYADKLFGHKLHPPNFGVARLLVKEMDGNTSPEEVERLDALTRDVIWEL